MSGLRVDRTRGVLGGGGGYPRAILCSFQISVDFYYVVEEGGLEKRWGLERGGCNLERPHPPEP
jgi:hypothetical protein